MGKQRTVVVDMDPGVDDAVALLLLLTLEPDSDFRLVAVTCIHGNSSLDNVCRNVLTTLQSCDRLDVPVYRGAEESLLSLALPGDIQKFYGDDGFCDIGFPLPEGSVQSENAVPALYRLAKENKEIVLICLGPLTNIALALRTYPEFSKYLKEVYIMGGNIRGVGNTTSAGEFNFFKDPEAAHIVLSSLACPTILLPWETCKKSTISMKERLEGDLGRGASAHMNLLDILEAKTFRDFEYWIPCDAFLAAAFLDPTVIKRSRDVHLSVELHGLYARGQVVVDHLKKLKPNVTVIEKLDFEAFKRLAYRMTLYGK